MIRPVLLHPHPVLRRRCAPVGAVTGAARALLRDLLDMLCAAGGRGLAAPQIGVARRAFVVDRASREGAPEPMALLAPRVVAASCEVAAGEERCPSIPGEPRRVTRPSRVTLRWTDAEGARREGRFEGALAAIVQHEADHLDGRLILDHAEPAG